MKDGNISIMNKYYIIENIVIIICFTILSILFGKWWIIFFSVLFLNCHKARDSINEAPIIDAEPVRHGKWIQIWENPDDGNNVICSCSVCGQNNNWYKNILHPYCPECGAKMDLTD